MKKQRVKENLKRAILLIIMLIIGIATMPTTQPSDKEFWLWLTIILLVTIIIAYVFLKEEQFELFDNITKENFKKAPIFGILAIPLAISVLGLIYTGLKYFILHNIIK